MKQKIKEFVQVNGMWSFFRTKEFLILVIVALVAIVVIIQLQSCKYKDGKLEIDPVVKKIEIQK